MSDCGRERWGQPTGTERGGSQLRWMAGCCADLGKVCSAQFLGTDGYVVVPVCNWMPRDGPGAESSPVYVR